MWIHFIRQKKAVVSLLFLLILVCLSIGNTLFNDGEIRRVSMLFDEKNQVTAAPFPPSQKFLLGTDRKGYDLLHLIIEGAKWTIGATVLITTMRICIGLLIAIIIGKIPKGFVRKIESFFDSFTIVPMTMIAYFLLQHVLVFANGTTPDPFYQRVTFELIILTVFAVPTLAFYLTNEIQLLFTEEYVNASRVLGGNRKHILVKHISPHIIPVLIILFMQQIIQVLIILVHLGVLKVFFGGTIVFFEGDIDSITHEWTGLLGMYYPSFLSHPWIPLVPILFFTLTILACNFILLGIEKSYENAKFDFMLKRKQQKDINYKLSNKDSFSFTKGSSVFDNK